MYSGVGGEGGAVRTPSSRAQKLKEEKLKRAEQVLKKYKECRTDSKGTYCWYSGTSLIGTQVWDHVISLDVDT